MGKSMKETDEVYNCIKKYPWFIELLKSKLLHAYCNIHTSKRRRFFCRDCMIDPFCTQCFNKNDHKGHNTIQMYRCSEQSGVRKDEISKYMDLSGIHLYSINGKVIVYIQKRPIKDNHRQRNKVSRKCQVCEWELVDSASSALFCSIECKFRSALGSQLDDLMENSESLEEIIKPAKKSETLEETKQPVKKKHRRKGIPQRPTSYGIVY